MNLAPLDPLRSLVGRDAIDLTALAAITIPEGIAYPPIQDYVVDLSRRSKPETASEHLFRALARDVLDLRVLSQINIGDGFVDFLLPETNGTLPVELKPLFRRYNETELRRHDLRPKEHLLQVRKYLHQHEYVVLTDLKDAYLFSARDTLVNGEHFARLPFADLLAARAESGSFLDVLRRIEDNVEKPELDRQFFEDLKEWYQVFNKVAFMPPESSAELVILLINKLVFAKTLEDHGLVAYRFIQDEYERQKYKWETKGPHRVVQYFLREFEDFFDIYYDTELFQQKIWDHLEHSPANLERFARALEQTLGLTRWDDVFKRGIVHYNYRRINEDIFGKSYEMFLAANRKDEGIYYTPAPITAPMADSLVESLFSPLVETICALVDKERCEFAEAGKLMAQLADIRIADTAAGSGGFLIKVLRTIWAQYARIEHACAWLKKSNVAPGDLFDMPPNYRQCAEFRKTHAFDSNRVLVARILLRHIHAIDKDGGALEVAKTNVWKEAVKLSPADYNFRQLSGDAQRILPNLELNFLCADALVDVETARQAVHLGEYSQHALQQLAQLREAYIADPSDHAPLEQALALREKLRANLAEQFEGEKLPEAPAFLALMFFPCWFDSTGAVRGNPGFDGIIGNPPWEAVKPVRKEFAKIDKYSMSVVDFEEWFAKKLREDDEFRAGWDSYQQHYTNYKEYLGRRFEHQGTGDWNYFKLFIENNLRLVRNSGQLSLLVPSSIQTDEGCGALRRLFITTHRLDEVTSFENRGYITRIEGVEKTTQIFPDVDSRFKFSFFKVRKGEATPEGHTFDARFYLHDPARVFDPPIKFSVEMMRRFSPQNLSLMEFRSEADYKLCSKIRSDHYLLGETGCIFRRELHPKDDVAFFHKRTHKELNPNEYPIFEGKMIAQYRLDNAPNIYFASADAVHAELRRKELSRLADFVRDSGADTLDGEKLPKKRPELQAVLDAIFTRKHFKLDYQCARAAYRRVGRSTDERTIIAAVLPSGTILTDTLTYRVPLHYEIDKAELNQVESPVAEAHLHVALLNSLLLNYYIRSKISATVNMFYVYELPVPPLSFEQREQLAASAAKLAKTPDNLAERARLEVFIARDLYGLSLEDWRHLTGSFIYGGDSDSKADLDEIIRFSLTDW
ncbi:MAG: N-6 DNA methylase [Verrucomicrobia bacterium]|nr:N-6 DNA methylase [Verrucomicrobiota bacterium]